MRYKTLATLACCGLLVFAVVPRAEAAVATVRLGTGRAAAVSDKALPTAWVAPVDAAPVPDGKLDDAAWAKAQPFVLGRLDRAGGVAPKTEVRLVHAGGVLYVGVRAAEPNVAGMKREVTQPDGPVYQDDSIELFLSPQAGGTYYQIILSAAGGVSDRQEHGTPANWNAGVKSRTAVGADHWVVEAAIPLASMLDGKPMPKRWRANVYRNRKAGPEGAAQAFSPTLSADYDVPGRFGHLLFTDEPPAAEKPDGAAEQKGIELTELDGGGAVLRFDLSAFAGKRIRRALLRAERTPMDGSSPDARANVEIYPLAAPFKEGQPPQAAGKALEPAAPWYRWFDVTDLAAAGKLANGLYVKQFPGWRMETTFLDVMFDGQPTAGPRVEGLKAVHRAGQTFLTWKEIDEPVGRDDPTWGQMKQILAGLDRLHRVRYCVYRSAAPITADTLTDAELIAEVEPLSGWNLNGRNIERPIDHVIVTATYMKAPSDGSVFDSARIDGEYGLDCPIDRFVVPGGEGPLARGTGLYVHTPGQAGRAYYAVLASVDGVQNTAAVAAVGPADEVAGAGEPVLQGELPPGPLWRYKQKRLHYVRWVAPPLCNLPSRCFNWSVGVPDEMPKAAPLELSLHYDRGSYWRTQYRLERDSIVLSPHDFPFATFWYGHHESLGTLRSFAQGTVQNYTQRRLLAFVDWAKKQWPVDDGRVLVTGIAYQGGFGALRLGVSYPEVFSLVITGHGLPDARYGVSDVGTARWSRGCFDPLIAAVGPPDWGLKTADGVNVWDALDVNKQIAALPPSAELPLVAMTSRAEWTPSREFYQLMIAKRRPVIGSYMWGGTTLEPVSATSTWPNAVRQLVRRDAPVLAFQSATVDAQLADGRQGEFNDRYRWRPESVVDQAAQFKVIAFYNKQYGNGETKTTDVTIRRRAKFLPRPGEQLSWSVTPVGGQKPTQSGTLTIGEDGLLVVPKVVLTEAGVQIEVKKE